MTAPHAPPSWRSGASTAKRTWHVPRRRGRRLAMAIPAPGGGRNRAAPPIPRPSAPVASHSAIRAHPPSGPTRAAEAAPGERARADPRGPGRDLGSGWSWLPALLGSLARVVAALCVRVADARRRARRASARWASAILTELAAVPGRVAGAIGGLSGRGARLLAGRSFRRAPEPAAVGDAAVADITTDDVDATARYLVGAGATWVGAVQVGGERCIMLRSPGGQVIRLFRANRLPDEEGRAGEAIVDTSAEAFLRAWVPEPSHRGWPGGWRRSRALPAGAGSGTNLAAALVLGLCGLAAVLVVTGAEDLLRVPQPAAVVELTDWVEVAEAAPPPSPPPALSAEPDRVQSAEPDQVQVAGTEGQGASLRAEPSVHAARAKVASEGAVLEVIGPDREADGRTWRNVRDPADGLDGWIAAEFLGAVPP